MGCQSFLSLSLCGPHPVFGHYTLLRFAFGVISLVRLFWWTNERRLCLLMMRMPMDQTWGRQSIVRIHPQLRWTQTNTNHWIALFEILNRSDQDLTRMSNCSMKSSVNHNDYIQRTISLSRSCPVRSCQWHGSREGAKGCGPYYEGVIHVLTSFLKIT